MSSPAARWPTSTCRTPAARATDNFNRYFYSQLDKQAVVLDERYNEGGFIADYIVNVLGQKPFSGAIERDGKPVHDPEGAIFGPKVMIINQSAGSGGDAMPWYFRKAGLGTLVGVQTWGGLVGIGGFPPLMDGGSVTAPRYAIYGLNGEWEVEGHGITPDVEVEEYPEGCRRRPRSAAGARRRNRHAAIERASGHRRRRSRLTRTTIRTMGWAIRKASTERLSAIRKLRRRRSACRAELQSASPEQTFPDRD